MITEFKSILAKHDIKFNQEAYNKDADYIKLMMKAEVARHLWNSDHYYIIRISADSQVETALSLMPEAKKIEQLHEWKNYSQNNY